MRVRVSGPMTGTSFWTTSGTLRFETEQKAGVTVSSKDLHASGLIAAAGMHAHVCVFWRRRREPMEPSAAAGARY
eukprot:11972787-Heterocapsa_arctica.AAC.1